MSVWRAARCRRRAARPLVRQAQPGAGSLADIAFPGADVAGTFEYSDLLAQHGVADFDCVAHCRELGVLHPGKGGHDAKPDRQA